MLDSSVVLATAAAVTERITIGYGVMLLALRPAAWAAKQISTGISFADRGRRTDEFLRVLPALVTGEPALLEDGLEVTLSPGSVMPPVLIAGNGQRALRRAAAYGDGWISVALPPDEVVSGLAALGQLAAGHGRPVPRATVVAPALDADPGKAAARLAAYAEAGTERVILSPSSADWQRDYEFAADLLAAL
jgi:alkanesulfonate monooxygenase SsuD/methylene tetrahydromethanopterin reductase-like flavin-dependent oxidoreductase (luciferase family)